MIEILDLWGETINPSLQVFLDGEEDGFLFHKAGYLQAGGSSEASTASRLAATDGVNTRNG